MCHTTLLDVTWCSGWSDVRTQYVLYKVFIWIALRLYYIPPPPSHPCSNSGAASTSAPVS